ncbi:MAG: DedA family protein [Armatimonadetes bacterium]|nr:DedA family protein [Armatimonadota bacterium]
MPFIESLLDLFLHLDRHLGEVFSAYGAWTYAILFVIVFCETGLVVTPFLPGDSLLFAAGALAGTGALDVRLVALTLGVAAFLGDNTNYWIGRLLGPKLLRSERSRFLNRKHLDKTHAFFERYGGKTIIMARFVPIVRTFTPFVAGVGAMTYLRFLAYSIAATILWIGVCVGGGYFFGGLPFVRRHFSLVVLAIIFISIAPALVEFLRRRGKRSASG